MTSPDGYIINDISYFKANTFNPADWDDGRMFVHSRRSGDEWPVQIDIENRLSFWLTQDQATTLAACILRAVGGCPPELKEFMETNK